MPGDYSNSAHKLEWIGTTTNRIRTVKGEIISPGSDDSYIRAPDSANWQLDGDFTIELWGMKISGDTGRLHALISQWDGVADQRAWMFYWDGGKSPKELRFIGSTEGVNFTIITGGTFEPLIDESHDVACERSGSTVRIYADGAMIAKGTLSGALFDSNVFMQLFRRNGPADPGDPFNGRIKAYRVTKSVARYADDAGYTVPSLPLPKA